MTQKRNAMGQFEKGNKLSEEHLKKMDEGRRAGHARRALENKEGLLLDLGFDINNVPPDVDKLADMFLGGKAGAVSAHTKLLARSPKYKGLSSGSEWDPDSGEPCPTCHGSGDSDAISKFIKACGYEGLDVLIEVVAAELDKQGETDSEVDT